MRYQLLVAVSSLLILCVSALKEGNCRYSGGTWSKCGAGNIIQTRTLTLKNGISGECPENIVKTRKCRQWRKALKSSECIYHHADWSSCDPVKSVKEKILTLMNADGSDCQEFITITKKCKPQQGRSDGPPENCKYSRGKGFSECDPETNTKNRTRYLVKGSLSECPPTYEETKTCKVPVGDKCKYYKGTWGRCDKTTNTKTMTRALRASSPESCNATITVTKECKGGKKKAGRSGKGQGKCKYNKGEWGDCDSATKTKTMVKTLRDDSPDSCNATMTLTKNCKGSKKGRRTERSGGDECKYSRGPWGPCDRTTNTKMMIKPLKEGYPDSCNATMTVYKKCQANTKRGRSGMSQGKCKYNKAEWGDCDRTTRTKTMVKTLRDSSPDSCNATMTLTKKCKVSKKGRTTERSGGDECKYKRGPWGPCDRTTNTKIMIKPLKEGSPDSCNATLTVYKECNTGKKARKERNECKYNRGPWGPCDRTTNTKMMIKPLKEGSPDSCNATMMVYKKCQANTKRGRSGMRCIYDQGVWTDCTNETKEQTRVDTIKENSDPLCPKTKTTTKKCSDGCRYRPKHDLKECVKNMRTVEFELFAGDPAICAHSKTEQRRCKGGKAAKGKCVYGQWTKFGPCELGTMKKTRDVISGGERCTRTTKTKPC